MTIDPWHDTPLCQKCGSAGPMVPANGSGAHPARVADIHRLRCGACGAWEEPDRCEAAVGSVAIDESPLPGSTPAIPADLRRLLVEHAEAHAALTANGRRRAPPRAWDRFIRASTAIAEWTTRNLLPRTETP